MSGSEDRARRIDARIRQALRGTAMMRAIVVSEVVGRRCTVLLDGAHQQAIVPALPAPIGPGSVVECARPRGAHGQLHVVQVLGVEGLSETARSGLLDPRLTFATPGDLAITYTTRQGRWRILDGMVFVQLRIVTASFVHTTAAGTLLVSGLPHRARVQPGGYQLSGFMQGWTSATHTQAVPGVPSGQAYITWGLVGSGEDAVAMAAADVPTGGTVALAVSGWYEAT